MDWAAMVGWSYVALVVLFCIGTALAAWNRGGPEQPYLPAVEAPGSNPLPSDQVRRDKSGERDLTTRPLPEARPIEARVAHTIGALPGASGRPNWYNWGAPQRHTPKSIWLWDGTTFVRMSELRRMDQPTPSGSKLN